MRPEIAAFRELEVLVRNLGEQLAGYRKRALTAEGKCRELEGALAGTRSEQDRMAAALADAKRALALKSRIEAGVSVRTTAVHVPDLPAGDATDDTGLRQENKELRLRLEQARERTIQVVDRVRFLRQQMTVEK